MRRTPMNRLDPAEAGSCGHVIAERVGQVVRMRKTVQQPDRNDVKM
jgi:hypothetical protein